MVLLLRNCYHSLGLVVNSLALLEDSLGIFIGFGDAGRFFCILGWFDLLLSRCSWGVGGGGLLMLLWLFGVSLCNVGLRCL